MKSNHTIPVALAILIVAIAFAPAILTHAIDTSRRDPVPGCTNYYLSESEVKEAVLDWIKTKGVMLPKTAVFTLTEGRMTFKDKPVAVWIRVEDK